VYDRLLEGAVDLHCHVDTELSLVHFRKAAAEWDWLPEVERAGVRAVVLKSHLWPTTSMAPHLAELYDGPVQVIPSITLNHAVGGLDPWAVEAALGLGARVVFMPTWGAANDAARGGFGTRLGQVFQSFDPARHATLTVLDEQGELSDDVQEILRLVRTRDAVLSTGHLGGHEALAIAREAASIGLGKVIFGHPLSVSVGASTELVHEVAAAGAYVEFCWPTVAPGRHAPADVVRLVTELGPDRVLLTSDFFGGQQSSPSALLRLFLGTLYDAGMTEELIAKGIRDNPARLLGLESHPG
jgi:hypothetical protein